MFQVIKKISNRRAANGRVVSWLIIFQASRKPLNPTVAKGKKKTERQKHGKKYEFGEIAESVIMNKVN